VRIANACRSDVSTDPLLGLNSVRACLYVSLSREQGLGTPARTCPRRVLLFVFGLRVAQVDD
jgi:hypothetical protein